MPEISVDANAIIEAQAQEIARLTHRAILAEVAMAEAEAERERLVVALSEAQGGDAS